MVVKEESVIWLIVERRNPTLPASLRPGVYEHFLTLIKKESDLVRLGSDMLDSGRLGLVRFG